MCKRLIICWNKWQGDTIANSLKKEVLSKRTQKCSKVQNKGQCYQHFISGLPQARLGQSNWDSVPDTATQKQLASSAIARRWERTTSHPVFWHPELGSTEYSGSWNKVSQFLFGLQFWKESSVSCLDALNCLAMVGFINNVVYIIAEL